MWKINFTIPTIGSPSYPYASFDDTIPIPMTPPNLFFKVVVAAEDVGATPKSVASHVI